MENTRAVFLIEKSKLSPLDKSFLLKHIETYEHLLTVAHLEILELKDAIDYSNALNDKILRIKKHLADISASKNIEYKINFVLRYLAKEEGKPDNFYLEQMNDKTT